ncbi:PiggyBac transposable element-derived protein 3 [Trichinella zimbabwensis]|uniref:PiggyBac transposable element-derived protein 3 n=1 Tax=Trichinella zimbabwensis TaxID=268475 RepID=A0A0V1GUZ5_9BILA|nr:PiggyBac transposable element-derived protein 3 [Trichinella zimbabwensis]
MDADYYVRRDRYGRLVSSLIVLPDADVSEPEIDSSDSQSSLTYNEDEELCSDEEEPTIPSPKPLTKTIQHGLKKDDLSGYDGLKNPIDYFKHFITDEMISLIVEQTNLYAMQRGSTFETSNKEIEIFLGLLVKMGVMPLPRYNLYWSADFRVDAISNRISRNRFIEILRYSHFNDNNKAVVDRSDPSYDRWFKIRPVLDLFLARCKSVKSEEKQCIDECIIPYKGRPRLRQYAPRKPQKWGFKVFARCGVSGFLYDFLASDGKHSTEEVTAANKPYEVVLKSCESLPAHKNHKVYFDNYFNFLELQVQLKEHDATLRRKGRGAFTKVTDQTNGVSVVKWFDNKPVLLSSTFASPAIIHEYNQHMGGVDLNNMLTRLYRIEHKSRKWYRRVFFWVIGAATTNAWLLYRRHQTLTAGTSKTLDLLAFTGSISTSLCLAKRPMEMSRRGRKSHQSADAPPCPIKKPKIITRSKPDDISSKVESIFCTIIDYTKHIDEDQEECTFVYVVWWNRVPVYGRNDETFQSQAIQGNKITVDSDQPHDLHTYLWHL